MSKRTYEDFVCSLPDKMEAVPYWIEDIDDVQANAYSFSKGALWDDIEPYRAGIIDVDNVD